MLRRLLKYEIKATARLFLPLYLVLLVFAGINRIFSIIHFESFNGSAFGGITAGISMTVYITLMVGTFVMTLVVLIQRFYKNLLGDEGYLMFTLPVQSWKHILNKLISSMIWVISSGIVALLSIIILIPMNMFMKALFIQIRFIWIQLINHFGVGIYLIGLETILISILLLASEILMIYAAIALGHLFNKHKLLASFGMYIVLGTISRLFLSAYVLSMDHFKNYDFTTFLEIQTLLFIVFTYVAIITAGYFILTKYILKKKLNLE